MPGQSLIKNDAWNIRNTQYSGSVRDDHGNNHIDATIKKNDAKYTIAKREMAIIQLYQH